MMRPVPTFIFHVPSSPGYLAMKTELRFPGPRPASFPPRGNAPALSVSALRATAALLWAQIGSVFAGLCALRALVKAAAPDTMLRGRFAPSPAHARGKSVVLACFTLGLVCSLLPAARAQLELSGRGSGFSPLWWGTKSFIVPNDPSNNPPRIESQPQFAADHANAGGTSAVSTSATLTARYPSQTYVTPGTTVATGVAILVTRSTFGGSFGSGVARYLLGDTIEPPATKEDGVLIADSLYWRAEAVKPGEIFSHPAGGSDTPVPAGTVPSFYYSPHAERVFASQPGRVTITWVTRGPITTASDATVKYRFRAESFNVSSATTKPTRTIYWTEKSFSGPIVNIPTGVVTTVKAAYTTNFPATVASEYKPLGVSTNTDPTAAAPAELRTLWFEKVAGIGQLRAYNLEGRIFLEYLGAFKPGQTENHVFLGADIVDVVRAAPTINAAVNIGDKITPRDSSNRLLPLDRSTEWIGAPLQTSNADGKAYYGTNTRADGRTDYYAERENPNPDLVTFYWLANSDAAIHFVPAPGTPNLGLSWPIQKNAYVQSWPGELAAFAHYTVPAGGSTVATGLSFSAGSLPQLIYQDDPSNTESTIDNESQRLRVAVTGDGLNRTLLRFSLNSEVWYVRLYSQAAGRVGFQESDGLSALSANAVVGERINAPAGYEVGGYIASGTNYLPAAYFDPFAVGTTAAAKGAIIPVNAAPGANVLTVWWFKKIVPPSATFLPFYTPAKIGTYTVSYPANPATIVLASNAGSGDLSGSEIAGALYYQNDRNLPGFNPNEEHALMLNGRAYALRDDLNDVSTNAAAYTSQPFVLLRYVSPDDARPALRVFKVLRELDLEGTANDVLFNYPVTAGTILNAPMPLPLLPLPLDASGASVNKEVTFVADPAPNNTAPSNYGKFTLKDRKGYDWVYRGPHSITTLVSVSRTASGTGYTSAPTVVFTGGNPNVAATATATVSAGAVTAITLTSAGAGYASLPTISFTGGGGSGAAATAVAASPSLGMQFYYTMREGFYVPGVATQPAVGTVLPYLRPLNSGVPTGDPITGTAQTIIYRPVWPESAPELHVAETLTLPKFGLPAVMNQKSAQVYYQQSFANLGTTKPSVILHDPLREKTFALGATGQLSAIPTSIRTTVSRGKTYFQGLPPHLQNRFFFDPLRGTKGALVLQGQFVDEIAGEDYLHLNVLSAADMTALKGLPSATDALWSAAVDSLATLLETFIEDPAKAGTYKSNGSPRSVSGQTLADISNPDTAVVNYALTATGSGAGWVTMVFGNGKAFTPSGDPVALQIFKVAPVLNTGELKLQLASNPLDEQVSLRHSGDFAAKPEDYEFEWRYAPPQGGVAPGLYSYVMTSRLATGPTNTGAWKLAQSPAGALPTATEYNAARITELSRTVQILAPGTTASQTRPGLVARSTAGVDFTSAVPTKIIFSATLADSAGLVLYVNGAPALAFNAPSSFAAVNAASSAALVDVGLARQFEVSSKAFQQGVNLIEVALYSAGDVGAYSAIDFMLHASAETDLVVASGSPWQLPNGTLGNQVIVGGSPTAPLGNPLLVMSDNYFTMRYRPKASANNVAGTAWSRWMPTKFIPGWIKRVLDAINPFEQRSADLNNSAINTDVSMLTQAGQRWEGNVALTLENINNFGLIEIYETVLNRAKNMSIDAGYDYASANDALLLVAGYLADLYTLHGNEAYADAINPTIAIDDGSTASDVSTSHFAFEGQVATVLQEELALLRGRDDFLSPSVAVSPAYNRLYWNYTGGIISGTPIYEVNYNIREKAGSPAANGVVDAADAQRMFPQGHGDAYGHYLTALKGYSRLLQSPNFTWTPRSEAVTILGQTVQIDYADERKFAAAAANLARTAQQVLALTDRERHIDDPAAGWAHLRDGKVSANLVPRHWGLDEWAARAAQGAYFNWIVGNALLPDKDTDPNHTGVQIIDRTTVPELAEIPALAVAFQTRVDNANAHLNPLGLSPGAIAFDISPSELKAGKSHYEQIHERALRSVLNAKGAFNHAAKMAQILRLQEGNVDATNTAIADQERAFEKQLIELYGTPYPGEVGAGKVYAQGYAGPDSLEWFIVDRPSALVDATLPLTVTARMPTDFKGDSAATMTAMRTITIQPNRYVQFADQWANGKSMGLRQVTGTLQQALVDEYQAHSALKETHIKLEIKYSAFTSRLDLYKEMLDYHADVTERTNDDTAEIKKFRTVQTSLGALAELLASLSTDAEETTYSTAAFLPTSNGTSNDMTSTIRGTIQTTGTITSRILTGLKVVALGGAALAGAQASNIETEMKKAISELNYSYGEAQQKYEYELRLRELSSGFMELVQQATNLQRANEKVRTLLAEGDRIQSERLIFRQRASALVQGYRTKDLTFRTFRNEALEQYRSLFDLAARYTYLAAKSYDYETGLLGSTAGQSTLNAIVASRALGNLTGGAPQATAGGGDSGLAGAMAVLSADWSVVKTRLGINNPEQNGTVFSLRRELFRLIDDPARTDDDAAWQQTLEQHVMSNILADADVATHARNLRKADGSDVTGIVIPFRTTIETGANFFGLPLAGGDHAFSVTNFATKIYSVGVAFRGYVGMDPYAINASTAAVPNSSSTNSLSATPYIYLIPTGTDYMLAPPLGDTNTVRGWQVKDQALPLPFNLGATAFSSTQFFNANGTMSEQPWILRKHQAFRPVSDPAFFYSTMPSEFTSARLVGRSVWNSGWKLVIPANTLLSNERDGLNRFVASVKDIELFLRTYSHSGN